MSLPNAVVAAEEFHVPTLVELFEWQPYWSFSVAGLTFDISFITGWMFFLTFLLCVLFLAAFGSAKVVPRGLQNVMEGIVDLIREQVVAPIMGSDGEKYMPLFITLFFWVFTMNVMGITPVINFPITSRMAIPVFLALMVWVVYNFIGIKQQGFVGYFKGMMFPAGVPVFVYPVLAPIEFFSQVIVRPITLAVRLFANMMAGHVMIAIFFLSSGYFLYRGDTILMLFFPFAFVASVAIIAFELFISLIQAFIITILTAVYIAGASQPEH